MKDKFCWGIMGTGGSARQFARQVGQLPGHRIAAVGSRVPSTANDFGSQYDIPNRHANYYHLAQDGDVDCIYIATPNAFHAQHMLMCLQEGKHVLCEKPFTLNADEAKTVIAEARQRGLFLMEAMWTRFLPAIVTVRKLIADGVIGELESMSANLSFVAPKDPSNRYYNPALGGGALLDVGVYAVSLAQMLFGKPTEAAATALMSETGVDEASSYLLRFAGGQVANLSSSICTDAVSDATINGTKGGIYLPPPFHNPSIIMIRKGNDDRGWDRVEPILCPHDGYAHEAAEVANLIKAGHTESPTMPLLDTLSVMQIMDKIRSFFPLSAKAQ